MKKILALILALMMMLFSVSALAGTQTVTVNATVNKDMLTTYGSMFGLPNDNTVGAVVSLINALSIKIVASDNAGELDLDLRDGQHLIAIGGAMADNGIVIGSDLFPSYLFSISQDYINQMMQQFMAQLPGGGQNIDIEGIMNRFYGYIGKFAMVFQTAVVPGAAETGSFEFEGFTFDTKTPMDVDEKALADAVQTLLSDILHDEFIADILKTSGQNVDVEETLRQSAEAMSEEHLPDVTVDVYTSTANSDIFYTESVATYKGQTSPSYRFTMLNKGSGEGTMKFYVLEQGITITVTYSPNGFLLEMEGNGAYIGLKGTVNGSGAVIELFFMDKANALVTLEISVAEGGTFLVNTDQAGKTVLPIEDLQNNTVDQTVQQGFMQELQTNGMPLIFKLMTAVPEAATLIQGAMSGM